MSFLCRNIAKKLPPFTIEFGVKYRPVLCHFDCLRRHYSSERSHFSQNYNSHGSSKSHQSYFLNAVLTTSAFTGLYLLYDQFGRRKILHSLAKDEPKPIDGHLETRTDLPTYSKTDVAKHNSKDVGIWVTYGRGVYDVTCFSVEHPGGDKILLAAGGSLEPFWAMYAQHKTKEVGEILDLLRIGNLDEKEVTTGTSPEDLAFPNEPERHPALAVHTNRPFNAEMPQILLTDSFITPNPIFFVRNHLPVPKVDDRKYRLLFKTATSKNSVSFTLDDLKSRFTPVVITSTIQCAGNRRSEMHSAKPVRGTMWGVGAISNATWKGVRLRDVLQYCGVNPEKDGTKHIHFWGHDTDPTGNNYGASIPVEKALSDETILAFEMNGETLPLDHGYPLRVIVPGVVGARQVKWLTRIEASKEESPSHWQQNDYRMYSPSMDWGNCIVDSSPSIQEAPVTSSICVPPNGAILSSDAEEIEVSGYAWSGGGAAVARVDVSADGGRTWLPAKLHTNDNQQLAQPQQTDSTTWSWVFWSVSVPMTSLPSNTVSEQGRRVDLLCKATDRSYNTQPESPLSIWNMRGLLTSSWHRITVYLADEKEEE